MVIVSRNQRTLLALALGGWILLGLAHTAVVMSGPRGWRPDRSAPGAGAVIGHPDDTDPMLVAAPLALVESAGRDGSPLSLLLRADTDSTSLLYARYQLAHRLYPRRVRVVRATGPQVLAAATADSFVVVAAPDVTDAAGCRPTHRAQGYRLLECAGR